MGPLRGFGYSSLVSDPLDLATWSKKESYSNCSTFSRLVDTKTSLIKMRPNILNVGKNITIIIRNILHLNNICSKKK